MSQEEFYNLLRELGGEATTKQMRKKAEEKFPRFALHRYIDTRLRRLEEKGYITKKYDKKGQAIWKIIEEYRARSVHDSFRNIMSILESEPGSCARAHVEKNRLLKMST